MNKDGRNSLVSFYSSSPLPYARTFNETRTLCPALGLEQSSLLRRRFVFTFQRKKIAIFAFNFPASGRPNHCYASSCRRSSRIKLNNMCDLTKNVCAHIHWYTSRFVRYIDIGRKIYYVYIYIYISLSLSLSLSLYIYIIHVTCVYVLYLSRI